MNIRKSMAAVAIAGAVISGTALASAGSASAVTVGSFCSPAGTSREDQVCQNAMNFAQAAKTQMSPLSAKGIVSNARIYCANRASGQTHNTAVANLSYRVGTVQKATAIGFGANTQGCSF